MDTLIPLIAFVVGLACGAISLGLLTRSSIRQAVTEASSATESEKARLLERLQARELALNDAKTLLPVKESMISSLQDKAGELERRLAKCEQELESEKKSAEEKLALLEQAEQNLTNVFKSLASDVLNTNNESFLTLAKTHFETVQETAKGELEKRQQAIVELVKPVKESLEKVDGKIQELEKVRAGAYSGLTEQVKSLVNTQNGTDRQNGTNFDRLTGTILCA